MLPPSRLVDLPHGAEPEPEPERPTPRRTATLLPWTIKLSAVIGLLALGTTHYLARSVESGTLRQREARAVRPEPETTGSIGSHAARTSLDPCTAAGLRR